MARLTDIFLWFLNLEISKFSICIGHNVSVALQVAVAFKCTSGHNFHDYG